MSVDVPAPVRSIVDLADPQLYATGDPVAAWAELRRRAPVYRNVRPDGSSFWALTTYDLVSRVFRGTKEFTSEQGMRLDAEPTATRASAGRSLIVTDPPRHTKVRHAMSAAFTPRMVARLERNMRTTVDSILDSALAEGTCDFIEVAARLPVSVICDLLGVPPSDWDFMLDRTRTAFGNAPTTEAEVLAKIEAHADILAYYARLAGERRRQPAEDVITALVHATVDGAPLTDEEIFLNCDGLISGGNETTRHATAAGLLALLSEPEQLADLRADRTLLPSAVTEILRYTSPALHVLRTARTDVELGDTLVRAGDQVTLWMPAANRDSLVFADGDRFDIRRDARRQLAFGVGSHYCLGSALASQELRVFFGRLLDRVGLVEPAGPVRRLASNLIWGIESMPVRLRASQSEQG
jgi:cytochrome P450